MNYLNIREVKQAVVAFGMKRTILVRGEKGIGKTSGLYNDLQNAEEFRDHIFVPPLDATLMSDGSIWMPEVDHELGVSREVPNEVFGMSRLNQRGTNGARPVFIIIDEVGKAAQYIKNLLATIVNERRIGGYYMPERSVVVCLSNLAEEGLGDSFQAHFEDRMIELNMRKPTFAEWKDDFAIPKGLNPEVVATCHLYPHVFDSFLDYEKEGKFAGKDCSKDNPFITNPKAQQGKVATPRSIHAACDIVDQKENMSAQVLEAALAGAVGEPFARVIRQTIDFGNQIPPFEMVINDPEKCPVPKDTTPQIVQTFQFIGRAQREHVEPIVTYVGRMKKELQGLFASSVASNTSKAAMFAVNKRFGKLLAEQRDFF